MQLILLTNSKKTRNCFIIIWFLPSCFLLWCCLFNRVNNFYVQFVSTFLHWPFLAAAPGVTWLVESQSWQEGQCMHMLPSVSFYKSGYLHGRQILPLGRNLSFVYTEKSLCEIHTLWILVVQLNLFGQAGGALMLLPVTLEHLGCPGDQALSTQPTHFIPPFLDICFY